jgi:hypothetical protein
MLALLPVELERETLPVRLRLPLRLLLLDAWRRLRPVARWPPHGP